MGKYTGEVKEIEINLKIIAKQLCVMNGNKYEDERSWIK